MIDIKEEVLAAEKRIRPYIRETLLDDSFYLSKIAGCHTVLKLENFQHTGSFKLRGAMNKLLSLSPAERGAGVVAASTGNHGLAVAYGLSRLNIMGSIFLPKNVSPKKLELLRDYEVDIQFYGNDGEETERHARSEARRQGKTYISPYNDPRILGGQGTVAVELMRQMASLDCIMVSVGGGGLISGIAGYLKEMKINVEIIGCLPQNSPVMYDSIMTGGIVNSPVSETLSDGTAGGIEADAITFKPCKRYVDDWILVSEDDIRRGIKLIFEQHGYMIEGAAGVVVASFLRIKERLKGKNVVLVICGGNIDISKFNALVFST